MTTTLFQVFFPLVPTLMSWDSWNGGLAEYYSQEYVPFSSEENWRDTANTIVSLPTFSVYPVPDPEGFETWQEWALEFTEIINGKPR